MRFDIITLFLNMLRPFLDESIIARGVEKGLLEFHLHDLRDWATDKHKTVDDTPYGGGAGMVLKVDVVDRALEDVKKLTTNNQSLITVLLTPQGKRFSQETAEKLAKYDRMILIAGHYEGFDERIRSLVDEELSLGDFVLTGGEIPAAAVVDAVSRLVPGVLGDEASPEEESFSLIGETGQRLLEYPHYTRPLEHKGVKVPDVLVSGNHANIKKWRLEQAKKRTSSSSRTSTST